MNVNAVIQTVAKMFPALNLQETAERAQSQIQGVPDSLQGVTQAARNLGLDRTMIDSVYSQVGKTPQARMICSLMGTTPEALKADAERIVSSDSRRTEAPGQTKFPRLKP